VLAINGEKDLQVPPKENLSAIQSALKKGGNKNYEVKDASRIESFVSNIYNWGNIRVWKD
jgi:fermentation-respiration switch protein FrsA (DUF1100 family)